MAKAGAMKQGLFMLMMMCKWAISETIRTVVYICRVHCITVEPQHEKLLNTANTRLLKIHIEKSSIVSIPPACHIAFSREKEEQKKVSKKPRPNN